MKIKIIEDETQKEDTITITTKKITPELQNLIDELRFNSIQASYRESDVVLNPKEILFFETDQNIIYAHTHEKAYETKYRLYELEESLPHTFMRVSKSSIANIKEISAIEHSFTSSRKISFFNSQKSVYVSRKYYPILKDKLSERSL
ncbi:MAG TPA: LytTR family DNA-binding domain-containing protein [Erysipelothrix sp.]|nr:LytTR family DNA-binding domain-containing protein [Erysipelothrix sp.]